MFQKLYLKFKFDEQILFSNKNNVKTQTKAASLKLGKC